MSETFARAELFVVLLAAMLALTAFARRLMVPYPILLVLGGLALAFIPGVPEVALQPDLVFVLFLPPILWGAAYFTSLRDFKRNLRSISGLALGLVLLTTLVVGWVAHELIPGHELGGGILPRRHRIATRCRCRHRGDEPHRRTAHRDHGARG